MFTSFKIPDPKPLIVLCDLHGFPEELTKYLWKNNFQQYIELYIIQINSNSAPKVLGTLIELEAEEIFLKKLLNTLRVSCPIEELIQEFESRNKLRVLENWIEQRL